MASIIVQYGKRALPLVFLTVQILIIIPMGTIQVINYANLLLALLSIIAYFWTALSNVKYR
jgi:hypothetical protein